MTTLETHRTNIKVTIELVASGLWDAETALNTVIKDAELFLIRPDGLYKEAEMGQFQTVLFSAKKQLLGL